MLFIEYPKCSTCKKAKKWLDDNGVKYVDRHIVEENPTYDELSVWISKYGINICKMFNTSGIKYRELKLKEKILTMNDDEKIKLLASDGMLVKRPVVVGDDYIMFGFREKEWIEKIK